MKMIENYFFFLMIIISFLSQIHSIKNLKGIYPEPKIIFTVYDYGKKRTTYNLHKLNENNNIQKSSFKLIYLMEKNLSSIERLSKYYNIKWMFFTQDKEIIKFLIEENKKINPLYKMFGIIFPDNITNYTNSTTLPLYHIEKEYIEDFMSFDVLNQTKNTYFRISKQSFIYEIPTKYLLITSSISLLISMFIVLFWNFRLRNFPDIISLHKYLIYLPYTNIVLAVLIFKEVYYMLDEDTNKKETNSFFLETGLFISNAVFRSFLWILFVLVSAGWKISKQYFNIKEIKHFTKMFFFIYLIMCSDQIFDSFNGKNQIIKISEIKNFFFYIIMIIYTTYKGINAINFLKRKLRYSIMFNIFYIPGLKIKIKMMKKHISSVYIFTIIYVLTMIIHKFLFLKFDSSKFEFIQYHYIDFIFMLMFLFTFRPVKLPPFFDIDYGENIDDYLKIYKFKIPLIEEFFDLNKPTKIIKKSEKNNYIKENIPVVVINPYLGIKSHNLNFGLIISNSNIGYINEN